MFRCIMYTDNKMKPPNVYGIRQMILWKYLVWEAKVFSEKALIVLKTFALSYLMA